MKRLAIATKGCGQLTLNYTYFADSWFSSVETAEEDMSVNENIVIDFTIALAA